MANAESQAEKRFGSFRTRLQGRTTTVSYLRLPERANVFRVTEECFKLIDIIPYKVTESTNPWAKPGQFYCERTFYVHRLTLGNSGKTVICPARTEERRCPICEYRAELANADVVPDELIDRLAPKERQLWNVYDREEPERNVQLWDISYFLFGNILDNWIRNAPEDEGLDQFYHPIKGFTLRLTFAQKRMGNISFFAVANIEAKQRKTPIPVDVLKQAYNLDTLLNILSTEELSELVKGLDSTAQQPSKLDIAEEEESPFEGFTEGSKKASTPEQSHSNLPRAKAIKESKTPTSRQPVKNIEAQSNDMDLDKLLDEVLGD